MPAGGHSNSDEGDIRRNLSAMSKAKSDTLMKEWSTGALQLVAEDNSSNSVGGAERQGGV